MQLIYYDILFQIAKKVKWIHNLCSVKTNLLFSFYNFEKYNYIMIFSLLYDKDKKLFYFCALSMSVELSNFSLLFYTSHSFCSKYSAKIRATLSILRTHGRFFIIFGSAFVRNIAIFYHRGNIWYISVLAIELYLCWIFSGAKLLFC